jgi:hypothetical protein
VYYGERLSRLEPRQYWPHGYPKRSSKLVHDLYMEYPYTTVHSECLDMMRHLVEYRQAFSRIGVMVASIKHPKTLSQFYEVFEQRLTRVTSGFPWGLSGSFNPRLVEPHWYHFRDTALFHNVAWAFGERKVYVSIAPRGSLPSLTTCHSRNTKWHHLPFQGSPRRSFHICSLFHDPYKNNLDYYLHYRHYPPSFKTKSVITYTLSSIPSWYAPGPYRQGCGVTCFSAGRFYHGFGI